jgi:hypothetical protein
LRNGIKSLQGARMVAHFGNRPRRCGINPNNNRKSAR